MEIKTTGKKYIKIYTEYRRVFDLLSYRQQHKLLEALFDYAESDGTIFPDKLRAKTMMVFNTLKPIIDGDISWEKIRQERMKAGKKGGNSRWSNRSDKQKFSKVNQVNSKNLTKPKNM